MRRLTATKLPMAISRRWGIPSEPVAKALKAIGNPQGPPVARKMPLLQADENELNFRRQVRRDKPLSNRLP